MPRTYVKKVGGRPYLNYRKENMDKAIDAVKKGMSKLQASQKFKVPRTTLIDKLQETHPAAPGRPCVLTREEEQLLAKTLGVVNDWGFPMTHEDIRQVVTKFVTKQGKNVPQWENNKPGLDFIKKFAQRNKLTTRLASNIKRQRAAVGKEQLQEFFENIRDILEYASPENVYNYDETNITDDPGSKKVLVPRGTKRVERVQEHSRTSISIMVCGSANGDLLPPMVVYKAQHLYENWSKGGPAGTIYQVTPSGWFDMNTFEQWFFDVLIPHINAKSTPEQTKVVIGDNLASHFSPRVVEAAEENNIYMTPLPANSTHLMQPLDVSFFAPMKRKWREILDSWRKECRRKGSIPKEHFPRLLNRLWSQIENTSATNLQSGFRATGLSPFNPERVLAKIPGAKPDSERVLDSSLLEFLQEARGYSKEPKNSLKRGKKVSARPGQQMQRPVETSTPTRSESPMDLPEIFVDATPTTKQPKTRLPIKPKKSKTVDPDKPGPSRARRNKTDIVDTDSDSSCSICKCSYATYTDSNEWICCVSCLKWVCGICNDGSKDPQYECLSCNCCCICLVPYSEYTNKKSWIKCVNCGKWVCGLCNKGSKQARYECPICFDED